MAWTSYGRLKLRRQNGQNIIDKQNDDRSTEAAATTKWRSHDFLPSSKMKISYYLRNSLRLFQQEIQLRIEICFNYEHSIKNPKQETAPTLRNTTQLDWSKPKK